jgi:DNA-directed RNA polymerase specialized sigma24 family protein
VSTGPARLLAAARSGDEPAFESLWRATQPGLSRYLRVVAPAKHADVAARVWIEVLHVLPRFRDGYAAWRIALYRTARAAARGTFCTAHPAPDARLPEAMTSAVLRTLAALPSHLGEPVALRYAAGLSVPEVAAVTGRPEAEVAAAVRLGTGIAAAVAGSPELRGQVDRGLPLPALPEPAEPGPLLLSSLAAPASDGELASWAATAAAFRAAVPLRPSRTVAVGKVAVIAAAATVALSGAAAAAYTGNLPAPLQRGVHDWVGAPAPHGDGDGGGSGGTGPAPVIGGAPGSGARSGADASRAAHRATPSAVPDSHPSPDPHSTSHPAPHRSDEPSPRPSHLPKGTPAGHGTTPSPGAPSSPAGRPSSPPGRDTPPVQGSGHP